MFAGGWQKASQSVAASPASRVAADSEQLATGRLEKEESLERGWKGRGVIFGSLCGVEVLGGGK